MWYRVFGQNDTMPQPADLQRRLRELGHDVPLEVTGDELGWTSIAIGLTPPLLIERYLTEADDLRDELAAWAAGIEAAHPGPAAVGLMQQVIATRQLFTLQCPAEASAAACDALARHLATETGGVFEADERGFHAADGTLLLADA